MTGRRLRVLVLYWSPDPHHLRPAIRHHLRALDYPRGRHRILYFNALAGAPAWLRHLHPDAVVLHTTFLCLRWSHLFPTWKWKTRWLRELDCVKIAIPQDEYDHSEILDEWLHELGVTDVFSNFDAPHRALLYPIMSERARFAKALTGYIDDVTAERYARGLVPLEKRPFDVVYRASHLPYWFGSHGQLKHRVAEAVLDAAPSHELVVDISTRAEDTITGEGWLHFLMSGRVVIGCESGSSVLDRRGEVRARIQKLSRDGLAGSFEDVDRAMPPGWDDYRFFALSPRHLEAVITKTCQVLVEGEYGGVLEPERHYIPLRRDFSNLDEVLERIKDVEQVRQVAERAYEEICLSGKYAYSRFAAELEAAIGRAVRPATATSMNVDGLFPVWQAASRAAERLGRRPAVAVPLGSLPKAALALRLVLPRRSSRRLLEAGLRDSLGARELLRDLLLLELIRLAQRERLGFRVTGQLDLARRRLLLRSVPVPGGGLPPLRLDPSTLRDQLASERLQVEWDHSRVGVYVSYGRGRRPLAIAVGQQGIHRFHALAELAPRLPDDVATAVSSALEPPSPRTRSSRRALRPLLSRGSEEG